MLKGNSPAATGRPSLGRRLLHNRRGATAAVVAIFMPIFIGGMAYGIDMASYRIVHSRMQAAVDAGALAGLMQIDSSGDITGKAVEVVDKNIPEDFGDVTKTSDITLGAYDKANGFRPATGADVNAVRVNALRSEDRGNGVRRIFSIFWGPEIATIGASAIAARPVNVFYDPPEGAILDNEAGDFNEMYAYCYDTLGAGDQASKRSQMTLIANNMPASRKVSSEAAGAPTAIRPKDPVVPMQWPDCREKGQTLSFRLRNVRHAKNYPQLWANANYDIGGGVKPGRAIKEYFTDTTVSDGVETFSVASGAILETVRCDSAAACVPGNAASTIPYKKTNRTPLRSKQACEPGKYMYFGWEDRPGGSGAKASWLDPDWTDKDFDDIAIRMKCPASGKLGDPYGRLVG